MKNILKKTGIYVVALLFLVTNGYPFYFLITTSFKSQLEYMMNIWSLPKMLYLENYGQVLEPGFMRYFLNSLIVTAIAVSFILLAASLASYVFARIDFKFKNVLFLIFIAGMMIPIHTTLIPVYVLTNKIGLYNTLAGLIGPYTSFGLPIAIFIMTGFFKEVPREVVEAATIDGCSHYMIYRSIMLPLSAPALVTIAIYNFLTSWNEFIYALVLINSKTLKTLPLGLRDFYGVETVNIPGILTAVLVGALPVMLFYLFAQEKVINGLVSGAVKG
jgi:raffinose/stachyose/melibiose transport system permease protein